MGMVAYFTAVNSDTVESLKTDPSLMEGILFPNDGDDEPENTVDIDKSWHGIHFILTSIAGGDETPLAQVILGGEEVGEDLGYGPPRVLTTSEVQDIARALEAVSVEQFESRFDPAAMSASEIYPDIWERDGKEALSYLVENFPLVAAFYRDAAARGDAAILWLA